MKERKPLLAFLFVVLMVVFLTACSVNTEEISNSADEAFNSRNYQAFNELYEKLNKANDEKANNYLEKVKENKLFSADSYNSISELSDGLDELVVIEKEVPSLSEYAKMKSSELNSKFTILKTVDYILVTQAPELESLVSKANNPVILMQEYEDVKEAISALETLSSDLNTHIINVEALDKKDSNSTGLLEAMKSQKENIDSKINYLKTNSAKIISSNSLILEGNIFGLMNSTDISQEMESIDSQIAISLSDLKQRATNLKTIY
ncbi:hypothetical protein MNQ98_10825 [Paenibacillus sp. N3/727]|uniref:hypothetical protein n=1 Tax=Paenibacillus sp. N3/727 TaxID=2925845 RepID=UPI001F532B93|nr:hypothetical protein [Paenibacillus sp. N3/727]UNK20467.1 hypothetical protein MNQ98_10825 [Paenibacillus sp. N3/727]